MKKIIVMLVFLLLFSACGNKSDNQVIDTNVKTVKVDGILIQEATANEKQIITEEKKVQDSQVESKQENNDSTNETSNNEEIDDNNEKTNEVSQDQQMIVVNIAIDCKTILDNMDKLDQGYRENGIVPDDGMILDTVGVKIKKGSTVLDVLNKVNDRYNLALKTKKSPYGTYVVSIKNIAEKICGRTSGWMYSVNGIYPGEEAGSYQLKAGDMIKWRFTCQPGDI